MVQPSYRTVEESQRHNLTSPRVRVNLGIKIFSLFFAVLIVPIAFGFWGVLALEQKRLQEAAARVSAGTPPEAAAFFAEALSQQQAEFAIVIFIAVLAAIFTALLIARMVVTPVRRMISAIQWMSRGGKAVRILSSGQDELAQLARSFNELVQNFVETQERERELAKLKSEFISIAAHQLRTPLSTIKWTFRMALDGDIGAITSEQKEFLGRGYESNERMIKLVSDLLDASRIEEGRFGYALQLSQLAPILDAEVQQAQQNALQKHITIRYEKPKTPLPRLRVDSQRISMAFANLLANAVNYTPPGGTIVVRVFTEEGNVKVAISDTGVGIPKEDMPRLFTKFFRAENVIRMQTEGTGMGLFISKNIARMHGGDITVASEEGKGSAFTMILPIAKPGFPA